MRNVKNSKTKDKNQFERYKRLELNIDEIPKFYKFAKKYKLIWFKYFLITQK